MAQRPVRFRVTLELPHGVSVTRMKEYLLREIRSGTGHLMPDDPLWALDKDSVQVTTEYPRVK